MSEVTPQTRAAALTSAVTALTAASRKLAAAAAQQAARESEIQDLCNSVWAVEQKQYSVSGKCGDQQQYTVTHQYTQNLAAINSQKFGALRSHMREHLRFAASALASALFEHALCERQLLAFADKHVLQADLPPAELQALLSTVFAPLQVAPHTHRSTHTHTPHGPLCPQQPICSPGPPPRRAPTALNHVPCRRRTSTGAPSRACAASPSSWARSCSTPPRRLLPRTSSRAAAPPPRRPPAPPPPPTTLPASRRPPCSTCSGGGEAARGPPPCCSPPCQTSSRPDGSGAPPCHARPHAPTPVALGALRPTRHCHHLDRLRPRNPPFPATRA